MLAKMLMRCILVHSDVGVERVSRSCCGVGTFLRGWVGEVREMGLEDGEEVFCKIDRSY